MDPITLSWVDYLLFVVMFGASMAIGIYYGCFGKQQTTVEYLLGGKRMMIFPVSMSLVASTLSSITLLGIPAEVYIHGTQYSMMLFALAFVSFINNFVYLPVFHELQLTSPFEYFHLRFGKSVKNLAFVCYTLASILRLPVYIYAPALAFGQVTGYNVHAVASLISLFCVFYTTVGGLKAVVWNDTLQFSVTLCTLCFILVMGTISIGGLATTWERSKLGDRLEFFNMDLDPTTRNTFWTVVLGSIFTWSSFLATEPAIIQRFMAVPTIKDAQKCLVIHAVLTTVTKSIGFFLGLIIYTKYHSCDPLSAGYIKRADQIMPYYVAEMAASIPGLCGLFVAGLCSTALSTLSTVLNTLSGILYCHLVAPFMPSNVSERKASTILKIITAVLGFTGIGLVFFVERMGTILEIILSLRALTGAPILGLFTLGMLFPFANQKGALFGGMGSFLLVLFILIKKQIHLWNGTIRYTLKPLDTYGCNVTTTTQSLLLNQTYTSTTECSTNYDSEEPFWLYRISFHYFYLIGVCLTLIIGLPISWATSSNKQVSVHPHLLSPFVRSLCSKSVSNSRIKEDEQELNDLGKTKNERESEEDAGAKFLD